MKHHASQSHDVTHEHHGHADGGDDQHDHVHAQDHTHHHGRSGWTGAFFPFGHSHSHGEANLDTALATSERGIWAIKISILALGLTTLFQIGIFWISGSVALLADTMHNFVDAVNGVPLWIALVLIRRAATRRYTYGYGRAEDLAGVFIVGLIFVSAVVAGYESYQRFINPEPLQYVWWVVTAALVGFVGNEAVALFEIRIGHEIGSAALIADGQHARIDGLTSLAVLLGALGSVMGFPLADPIVGLLITLAILFIVKDTAVTMWHRLMDAVDPAIVDSIERVAAAVPGAQQVHDVRARWLGHQLYAELHVVVDEDLPTRDSHQVVEDVRHALFHAQPRLSVINVHVDPCGHSGHDPHRLTTHHKNTA
jgi:cation diffusion facilitator family transporter